MNKYWIILFLAFLLISCNGKSKEEIIRNQESHIRDSINNKMIQDSLLLTKQIDSLLIVYNDGIEALPFDKITMMFGGDKKKQEEVMKRSNNFKITVDKIFKFYKEKKMSTKQEVLYLELSNKHTEYLNY